MRSDLTHLGCYFVEDIGIGKAYHIDGLTVLASTDGGWDHVSVSRGSRDPYWAEMCKIKDLFFDDEECAVQYHPKKSEYVNLHPHCLHLWRNQDGSTDFSPREKGEES